MLLIVQLSDIHVMKESDHILGRAGAVASAIVPLALNVSRIVIVCSGDIAFSGKDEQYFLAYGFLEEIREKIKSENPFIEQIDIVTVPGNHDLDFDNEDPLRARLLSTVPSSELCNIEDLALVDACARIQANYFDFREQVSPSIDASLSRIFWEYQVAVEDVSVVFRCFNTAWMSEKKEKVGSIVMPAKLLPERAIQNALYVSIFHHPFNWFQADKYRDFRAYVEDNSDIVFTGHEHVGSVRSYVGLRSERSQYIEGAVLQETHNPSESAFNCLLIDLVERKQKFFCYKLSGERYIREIESEDWSQLHVAQSKAHKTLSLAPKFEDTLLDPGVTLMHPRKANLTLPEVFVYPDLRRIKILPNQAVSFRDSSALLVSNASCKRVMVIGDDRSGKSSLAKMVFKDLFESGSIPLLLNGSDVKLKSAGDMLGSFETSFKKLYRFDDIESWRQASRDVKVLIVDDFHLTKVKHDKIKYLLSVFEQCFGRVYLFSDEYSQEILDLFSASVDQRQEYEQYRLMPLSYSKREDFIQKWHLIESSGVDEIELVRSIRNSERMINSIVNNNFVPPFPVFLLSILQSEDSFRTGDAAAGTYGYYYEIFIKSALAKLTRGIAAYDVSISYLSLLAYSLYQSPHRRFSKSFWKAHHTNFLDQFGMEFDLDIVIEHLIEGGVVCEYDDGYEFKYSYVYYYFVANFFKDRIDEEEARVSVGELISNLHQEEASNILLFLSHLSKNSFIVTRLLEKAATIFDSNEEFKFAPDHLKLLGADTEFSWSFDENRTKSARKAQHTSARAFEQISSEEIDAAAKESESDIRSDFDDANSYISKFGSSFKTIGIIGQILRNFPGSILVDKKEEMAKCCFSLAMRAIGSWFELLETDQEGNFRFVMNLLQYDDPNLQGDELVYAAKRTVFNMATSIGLSTIRRLTMALGSNDLFSTYDRLRAVYNNPGMDLLHLSLRMELKAQFPKHDVIEMYADLSSNPMAKNVLQGLVVNHFYAYPIGHAERKSVCNKLGIAYSSATSPRAKLLPEPK